MTQKPVSPSIPAIEQEKMQTSLLSLMTVHRDLLVFVDSNSQLAFECTCKALYEYYELYYENEIVAVLYVPQDNLFSYTDNIMKIEQRSYYNDLHVL
jgi:hypothetical protein